MAAGGVECNTTHSPNSETLRPCSDYAVAGSAQGGCYPTIDEWALPPEQDWKLAFSGKVFNELTLLTCAGKCLPQCALCPLATIDGWFERPPIACCIHALPPAACLSFARWTLHAAPSSQRFRTASHPCPSPAPRQLARSWGRSAPTPAAKQREPVCWPAPPASDAARSLPRWRPVLWPASLQPPPAALPRPQSSWRPPQ